MDSTLWNHVKAVRDLSSATGPAKAIMFALASRADAAGCCYPGVPRLADDSGQSQRTVMRHLPALVRSGELQEYAARIRNTRGGPQTVKGWRIQLFAGKNGTASPPVETTKGVTASFKGGDSQSTKGETLCPQGGDSLSAEGEEKHSFEENPEGQGCTHHLQISGYEAFHNPQAATVDLALSAIREEGNATSAGFVRKMIREKGDTAVRSCVEQHWGEMRTDRMGNPGKVLFAKLKKLVPAQSLTARTGSA